MMHLFEKVSVAIFLVALALFINDYVQQPDQLTDRELIQSIAKRLDYIENTFVEVKK